jgi:nucleoid-associated protein YgaU
MPKKATTKTQKPVQVDEEQTQSRSSLFDYLRFGESYTSLILGIIVVIISTVLLLSFVHNKNVNKDDNPQLLSQSDIALPSDVQLTGTEPTPVVSKAPVVAPTRVAVNKPAAPTPTQKPAPTAVVAMKAASTPTPTPAKLAQAGTTTPTKGEYVVAAGENLWTIAEKNYKSGYNWVDIARANNLSNPGVIHTGDKLKLPKVDQKIATVEKTADSVKGSTPPAPPTVSMSNDKITGTTYTTVKGDTLWNIAVRAYGDGFQWQKIASANNLSNPRLIHSGNSLKIPRG